MDERKRQTVAGVILAAGASSRMGRPKQLLNWGGRPLVRVAAEHALASLDHVVVVVGGASAEVAAALGDLAVEIVVNNAYAEGQSTSLRAGIAALAPDVAAALVLLGDQPFVTPGVIDRIVAAWRQSRLPIAAPVYRGQRGNPVLFAHDIFPELLTVRGDQGARDILRANPSRVQLVSFNDDRPLADIDTPEDYASLIGNRE